MTGALKQILEKEFSFQPNKNQLRDIERLIFEIIRRENTSQEEVIAYLKVIAPIHKYAGRNRFFVLKEALIKRRFPLTSQTEKIDTKKVFLSKVRGPLKNNWQTQSTFRPLKVFVERAVKSSYLVKNFHNLFPDIEIEELNYYTEYLKKNKFTISELKKPLIFIVKETWDFLKNCPCTRRHMRCGYWILNLGFGCPYDCSYCFLQHYTNFPGMILPANIDDFFEQFDRFCKNLKRPIRIGTGEFCDSLALDHITEYSKKTVPYFKTKNVYFELKTKSAKVDNLLAMESSPNIIISWSLNPSSVIKTEEYATASLEARLAAAKKVQEAGYKCAFHFDPIIHSPEWEKLYREVIDSLYTQLKAPFSWISLGTLRSNRELKTAVELRFPKTHIFYGELLLGEDKKLRYPKFLRAQIYKNMVKWIRERDLDTPLYFCMEDKEMWRILGNFSSDEKIESYLLGI
ncbi:MAG: hypothetical protein JSW40_06665 [Candidatus Omnitrophota bacterium]|nr:MAG: hypothetical protein JSW40_06665 [Candidatus Omnitrophota bacterium]